MKQFIARHFRRFKQTNKDGIVHDVGWAIQFGRIVFRFNKQTAYTALTLSLDFGTEHYKVIRSENERRLPNQKSNKRN